MLLFEEKFNLQSIEHTFKDYVKSSSPDFVQNFSQDLVENFFKNFIFKLIQKQIIAKDSINKLCTNI